MEILAIQVRARSKILDRAKPVIYNEKKPKEKIMKSFLHNSILACFCIAASVVLDTSTAGAAAASLGAASNAATSTIVNSPNIIFILADDLAYDDLGSYGSDFIETPNIDALAGRGMSLTNFYTTGNYCTPTRHAIYTGQNPGGASGPRGVIGGHGIAGNIYLPASIQAMNYEVWHLGKWHLGHHLEDSKPWVTGLDHYFGWPTNQQIINEFQLPGGDADRYYIDPFLQLNEDEFGAQYYEGHLTDILTDSAINLLNSHVSSDEQNPFFLTLWHYAPHGPNTPQSRWLDYYNDKYPEKADSLEAKYAALITGVDESVARIVAELERLGLADNTIIVFTSDNGGAERQHPDGITGLRGFKTTYYEGGIKVPFIAAGPGIPIGTSDALASTLDLFPTFLDIAGGSRADLEGESIVPMLFDSMHMDRTLYFPHTANNRFPSAADEDGNLPNNGAIRKGDWKLLVAENEDKIGFRPVELYNIALDQAETTNLLAERPDIVDAYFEDYSNWFATNVQQMDTEFLPGPEIEFPENTFTFVQPGLVRIPHSAHYDLINREISFTASIKPFSSQSRLSTVVGKGAEWQIYFKRTNLSADGSLKNSRNSFSELDSRFIFALHLEDNGQCRAYDCVVRLFSWKIPSYEWTDVGVSVQYTGGESWRLLDGIAKLYINGVLTDSEEFTGWPMTNTADVFLGSRTYFFDNAFYGVIKDPTFARKVIDEPSNPPLNSGNTGLRLEPFSALREAIESPIRSAEMLPWRGPESERAER